MKITVLSENYVFVRNVKGEHGLSLFIETDRENKILFDMGQGSLFCENASNLGIRISDVDAAIISHGHYDHGGGLETFLKNNSHAPVYVNKNAFGRYYSKNGYIGLTGDFSQNERVILTDNEQEIFPFAKLVSGENFEITEDNYALGLEMETEFHEREKDSFIHEQYLLIEEKGKRILISGCSHRGILNIMNYFKPHVFVGGFHLFSLDADSKEMEYVSKKLSEYDTTFYTCHCTGMEQYGALKSVLKEKLKYISCGKKFDL